MQKSQVDSCTIFKMVAGSRSYGTNTPESDYDYRGVCIPTDKAYYFGFKKFEQFEDKANEIVIYDIRKALNLIADANPNMMDLLFADPSSFVIITPAWQSVIEKRDLFLSKKARFTYTGYAYAQLKRIKTHRNYLLHPPGEKPERSKFDLPEDKKLVPREQIGAFQAVLAHVLKDNVQYLHLSDATKNEMDKMDFFGLIQAAGPLEGSVMQKAQHLAGATDEFMAALQKEHQYVNALREWQSYENWKKTRNEKRQALEAKHGYDTKHAMHLVRLMRMGKEILGEGKVIVKRPDAEELLAIRNGAWTFDQVEEYAEKMQEEIALLYEKSKLPNSPNRNKIEELCISVTGEYLLQVEEGIADSM